MQKIDKTETLKKILSGRRFTVDYFQREYRWGRKQIEQMINDLQTTFEEFYDPSHDLSDVANYGYYYMGSIICTGEPNNKIIDGQQRLTSLTLLLIYLNNLQKDNIQSEDDRIKIDDMIYDNIFGKKKFNIDVPEREQCMQALYKADPNFTANDESSQNMLTRYNDITECFPDNLKEDALPFFINWLIERVLLLEIDTPSEDEAHTIFLTMNDRGLSLNSTEMMKAYIIQQVTESDRIEVNHRWQENINKIKNASSYDSSGEEKTEDVEFISMWLRAKYANSLRETKKDAKDEDFELLGDKFYSWVRNNALSCMKLQKSKDFKSFVMDEMTRITDLYLRLKKYSTTLTKDYEEVFYNANRDLNYQYLLIISSIANADEDDTISTKIKMISKFVDDFASVRIFNYKKVNWNTNKYLLFKLMKDIRNQDLKTIGMVLYRTLRRMDEQIDGLTNLSLNQFTGRYMLHLLARFTSFVNVLMGNPSQFDVYTDRTMKGNTYDIEHILPDKFDDYKSEFNDPKEFQTERQFIGNLIILTRDKNRSYKAMNYADKVKNYSGDNILAQALNTTAYHNNPQFLSNVAKKYGFEAIVNFNKQSIRDRAEIYLKMAYDIWNPTDIKTLSGGWSDEEEKEFFKNTKFQEFTVTYADRSWSDALKYGFLSANINGSGRYLFNIQPGDIVFCYITGKGFVGIGECLADAVPMSNFKVDVNGTLTPVEIAPWDSETSKDKLDSNNELFIRVDWKKFTTDPTDGYWEKGMTSVPLVAYKANDKTIYKKVKDHFNFDDGDD
jgi:uncharacterized protein with ParB-like and HNH nuclease domain